ncbi:MAG: MBL fold metallo-hydrolase [Chitinophagaceae bacterium]
MNRRAFLRNTSLSFATLSLTNQRLLSQVLADPMRIKMLTDDIGVFTEMGGTILFYLSTEGIAVIDSEFPDQSKHLIEELRKKSDKPFSWLINTHHHGDHTSGNISFKGMVSNVLAHENSLKNQKNVATAQKTEEKQLYPEKTFSDKWNGSLGKEKIALHYFGPAHTDGDAIVHFQNANIVHMGDLINNRRYPFIDQTAGASIKNWIIVLDKALNIFDDKATFVYGHASPGFEVYGKKEDLRAMKNYFEKLIILTESSIKSGVNREKFLAITSIPGVTDWVGEGIQRSLTAAYNEFSPK